MHLLDAVESLVGQFDTWPTYMLKILFCEDPAYDQLKRYAAFCYGNGVPISWCVQLYVECNCKCTFAVTQVFREVYYVWQRSGYKSHLDSYFNMHIRKFVYLNGWYHVPMEVLPQQVVPQSGLEHTGCRLQILEKIQHLRTLNLPV